MKKLLLSLIPIMLLVGCGTDKPYETSKPNVAVEKKAAENKSKEDLQPAPTTKNEQKSETTKKPQTSQLTKPVTVLSQKEEYLKKLDETEKSLSDLQSLYKSGVTAEMHQAVDETYKRWDNDLNEIYAVLKKQLSPSDMNKLKHEELAWIQHRDEVAKEESSQFQGGTMEPVQYTDTEARLTKERCYELVNKYMK